MEKGMSQSLTIAACLVAFFINQGLATHHPSYNGLDLLEHYSHHPRKDHMGLAPLSPQDPYDGSVVPYGQPQILPHEAQLPPQDGNRKVNYYNNRDHGIMCYECNSEYDPRCKDPFDSYSIGMVNCSLKAPLEHLRGFKPILCRKSIQKVYGVVRVVRGCGYVIDEVRDDSMCVRRSGTHDVAVIYCSCTTSLCNAANPSVTLPNILLASISVLFYFVKVLT